MEADATPSDRNGTRIVPGERSPMKCFGLQLD
jgi:hypothetical protein